MAKKAARTGKARPKRVSFAKADTSFPFGANVRRRGKRGKLWPWIPAAVRS